MIKQLNYQDVLALRQKVLRPHQKPEECIYSGDKEQLSGHFGKYIDGKLIGIASIYNQAEEGMTDSGAWRIRGMATLPDLRGQGFGLELLDACINHAKSKGGKSIWCNGREKAISFYKKRDFYVDGEPFELPSIGLHFLLRKIL